VKFLGFDPLYVANEGRFIAFVPGDQAGQALKILRANPLGADASRIGAVRSGSQPMVTLRAGSARIASLIF